MINNEFVIYFERLIVLYRIFFIRKNKKFNNLKDLSFFDISRFLNSL